MEEFDHLPKLPLLPWFIGRRKREAMARATNHVVDATQAFDVRYLCICFPRFENFCGVYTNITNI